MRESLLIAGLFFAGLVVQACAGEIPTINFDSLALAISDVESGGHPEVVGKAGERGLMQIKSGTWEDMTAREFGEALPFDLAFEPELNLTVGRAYLCYLSEQLAESGAKFRAGFLHLLVASYNRGPQQIAEQGYSLVGLSPEAESYVERVLNLHAIYETEQLEPPLVQWAMAPALEQVAEDVPEQTPAARAEVNVEDEGMARDLMQSFSQVLSVCLRLIPLSFTGILLVGVRRNNRMRALETAFLGSLTLPRLRLPSRERSRRS